MVHASGPRTPRPRPAPPPPHRLTGHPDFDWKNPNRFRAVIGALAANAAGFHDPSGAGYRLLADWLIRLDPREPADRGPDVHRLRDLGAL